VRRGLLLICLPVLVACGTTTTTKTVGRTAATSPAKPQPSTPATTTRPAATGAPAYFQGAVGDPAQRPGALELTADGTLSVGHVQWTSWGGPDATGTGNASYHGCTPNCAQAPVHTALVSVHLSRVRTCGGRRYYSSVTLTLNSGQLLNQEFLQRSWSPC
jgi:hypothetical protein